MAAFLVATPLLYRWLLSSTNGRIAQGPCMPHVPEAVDAYAQQNLGGPRIVRVESGNSLETPELYGSSICNVPVTLDNGKAANLRFHWVIHRPPANWLQILIPILASPGQESIETMLQPQDAS